MTGVQAGSIGGALAVLVNWLYGGFYAGDFKPDAVAGGAITILLREFMVLAFAGGEEPPEVIVARVRRDAVEAIEQAPEGISKPDLIASITQPKRTCK